MEIAVWTLTVMLTLLGLVGVLVPVLPGTTLMLLAMVVHKLILPAGISWGALGWVTLFWFLSVVVDFAGVLIGTRMFGGSKWGIAGASGGAFLGMFFSLPALLLGTICGAIVAERYAAKKTRTESLRAGAGAAVGFVLSTIGRFACAIIMIVLFLLAAAPPRWAW